ncbi:ABC transporter permease subunit [Alteromonas sp. C1M14]|uniref:ABC transporter permease subunit n=1 Tax=Alteromonas sp. C1M14 TaxID=2841567 RepID=UPI0020915B8C|nr:ABC transporter permease subunit [Alteromonas sp. C1M14]
MKWRQYVQKGLVILPPYLWLLVFFLVPFLIVFGISLTEPKIAQPPYSDIVTAEDGRWNIILDFSNYLWLLGDELYPAALLNSLNIAFWSTCLCILIGFPMAWFIAKAPTGRRNLYLMLVVLPSWTSFLIRIYAWMGILRSQGPLNQCLMALGIIDSPLRILNTEVAVYIGIVYCYLPFFILPLYSHLIKLDGRLLDAAADLGAGTVTRFVTIVLPLAMQGVIAGGLLVFIPIVGEFVVPELLGGSNVLMIGKVLWTEFFANRDWPVASAVATVLLVMLLLPIILLQRFQDLKSTDQRGQ